MDQLKLTRKELYNLVWKESMLSLSKRYDISDTGLRKMCVRMEIPVPPAGYWAKIQFGKKVKQVPLPAAYKGADTIELQLRDANNPRGKSNAVKNSQILSVENDANVRINVPEQLTQPDPLVILSKSILAKQKPSNYNGIGTVSCRFEALNIIVAKDNVDRALLFFDTLIKNLKARGHKVELKNRETITIVNGQEFEIQLREKMRQEKVLDGNWTTRVLHPKGILAFKVNGWYGHEYNDGTIKIEGQMAKIIAGIELSAKERNKQVAEAAKAKAEREEKERLAKELLERKQQDLLHFKALLQNSERWHKAENLRRYIQEFENRSKNNQTLSTKLQEWLEWAKRKADWYDPFMESPDELLTHIAAKTIIFYLF